MLKSLLFSIFFFTGICLGQSQDIVIKYNQVVIPNDGSNTPKESDGTLYNDTQLNRSRIEVFSIYNERNKDVNIDITLNSSEFKVAGKVGKIKKDSFIDFELNFEPTILGVQEAVVTIEVKQGNQKTYYSFNVKGNVIEDSGISDIMISQYYENSDIDFVEITNLSAYSIKDNQFYLALYKSTDNLSNAPKKGNTIDIKEIASGEVRVYDKFELNGDDIIIISASKGKDCFGDRVDIIGEQESLWGEGKSLIKGACASESAHNEFDPAQWIALSLSEVDNSFPIQNLFLGTHQGGPIVWNGSNWTSSALPDRTRTVRIEGLYSSESLRNIEACDLIIDNELDFDNNGKKSVVVHRNLSVTENGNFQLGDQESLVMYDDLAEITGEIKKIEKTTQLNNSYDFTYWSSPISNASVATVFSGVRSGRTYYFDQSKTTASSLDNDPEGTYWDVWVTANGTMKSGRGYASEGKVGEENIHQISFDGSPNNGVIYEQVHFNDDNDDFNDFNLIGNPYPSAINIDLFFDKNEQFIDPTIYLWTHTTPISEQSGDYSSDDYATYNRTGGAGVGSGPAPLKNIGSGQGFMVRALAGVEVEFNNSMRLIDSNDQFFKSSIVKKKRKENEKDRIWLNLSTDQGGFNQLLIGFVEGASSGFDRGYDALKNQGANKISFYTLLDKKKLAIQGLGSLESRSEITLGFDTQVVNRTYTIAVSAVEGELRNAEIILHDHVLNLSHDLTKSNYIFEQDEKGSYQDRFSLIFIKEVEFSTELGIKEDQFIVHNEGDTFSIDATEKVATVRIYDLYGNLILESYPDNISFDVFEPTSNRGDVLLMQIIHADQSDQIKKIYKR